MKFINNIIFRITFCLVLIQVNRSLGQEQVTSTTPTGIPELQRAIQKVLKETKTPAVGVALVQGDSLVWTIGLGKANVEKNVDADEDTMFRIGSTSKIYVSLAILKLQEEGRLSLKDKVRDLVPEIEFKNPWQETSPILVEHLLEHTTGWDDFHLREYAMNEPGLSIKEGLDYHPPSRTSRWTPGTRMSYCNSGPPVAAYIVEKITGRAFEDYIQEHFFDPMGMETMTYFETDDYKDHGATLYAEGVPQEYWYILQRPAGSINASANDMAKMVQFFIDRGRLDSIQIISEASLERMETPTTTIGAKAGIEYGYGLSNYSSPYKSFVYRKHSGAVPGGICDFSYLPGHDIGYAIMINADNGGAFSRIVKLIRDFQTQHLESEKVDVITLDKSAAINLSGYYEGISPGVEFTYFLEKILNVNHIWHDADTIFSKDVLGGDVVKYLAKNETQFIYPKTRKVGMVKAVDPLDGMVIIKDSEVFKQISPIQVFGRLILGGAWLLGMISSILFGVIWAIRYWMGKISGGANIQVRLWPLIASISFTAVILLMGFNGHPFILGRMNFVTISIMVLTILSALASAWSMYYVIWKRHADISRIVYWYSSILACLHLIVTCYLLWYGVIGVRLWT